MVEHAYLTLMTKDAIQRNCSLPEGLNGLRRIAHMPQQVIASAVLAAPSCIFPFGIGYNHTDRSWEGSSLAV